MQSSGLRERLRIPPELYSGTAEKLEKKGFGYAVVTRLGRNLSKYFKINGAGGGNRTHGLGIMRPSLYH